MLIGNIPELHVCSIYDIHRRGRRSVLGIKGALLHQTIQPQKTIMATSVPVQSDVCWTCNTPKSI